MNRLTLKPSNLFKLSASLLLLSQLSACGGTEQDKGTMEMPSTVVSGVALDGHIARAKVFLDLDNNGTRDPWEPYAFTDDQGYFSYNPITGVDYCADPSDEELNLYCLRSARAIDKAVLRVDGGYDVLTGEPFVGQLSRRLSQKHATPQSVTVLSPMTTLLTDVASNMDKSIIMASLGIDETDLDVDYLNTDGQGSVDSALFNTAVKVHKVVTVLADRLEDTYDEIGAQSGTPNDLSARVYRHLAKQLTQNPQNLSSALDNRALLNATLAAVESDTREIYRQRKLALPTHHAGELNLDRAVDNARRVAQVVEQLIPPHQPMDPATLTGRARAVETLVIKALEEDHYHHDDSIERATEFLLSADRQDLVQELVHSLSQPNADVAMLVRNRFDHDLDSPEGIARASRLPDNAMPLRNLVGQTIRVSDLDLGQGPDRLKDSEIKIYFQGDQQASKGRFNACVKYIEDAHENGTLGEANTRGELVQGQWSLMGAERNQGESYSLLLTIKFLGSTHQAIIKPAGYETVNGMEHMRVRFDQSGGMRAWHSEDGLQAFTSIPSSHAQCRQVLPSRVGL